MIVKKDVAKGPDGKPAEPNKVPKLVKTEIPAQGLWRDRDGLCYWRRMMIQKYLV